jgi:hypothetical protein
LIRTSDLFGGAPSRRDRGSVTEPRLRL